MWGAVLRDAFQYSMAKILHIRLESSSPAQGTHHDLNNHRQTAMCPDLKGAKQTAGACSSATSRTPGTHFLASIAPLDGLEPGACRSCRAALQAAAPPSRRQRVVAQQQVAMLPAAVARRHQARVPSLKIIYTPHCQQGVLQRWRSHVLFFIPLSSRGSLHQQQPYSLSCLTRSHNVSHDKLWRNRNAMDEKSGGGRFIHAVMSSCAVTEGVGMEQRL